MNFCRALTYGDTTRQLKDFLARRPGPHSPTVGLSRSSHDPSPRQPPSQPARAGPRLSGDHGVLRMFFRTRRPAPSLRYRPSDRRLAWVAWAGQPDAFQQGDNDKKRAFGNRILEPLTLITSVLIFMCIQIPRAVFVATFKNLLQFVAHSVPAKTKK
jgi:hypothetical protein